jgi:hypothetical protein
MSVLAAAATTHGIWDSDTVGLLFTWVVLLPAIANGLIIVAVISARGDKAADDKLRSGWGAQSVPDSE